MAIVKKKKTRINYKFINTKEDSVSKEWQIKKRIKVETIYPAKIYDETLISDNLKTYEDRLSDSSQRILESRRKEVIICPIYIPFIDYDDILVN